MSHISREREMVRSCGHPIEQNWEGREEAERLLETPCDVCAMDLPELEGSDKQISWAEDIRREAIQAVEDQGIGGPEAMADALRDALYGQSDAGWWIDHRSHSRAVDWLQDAAATMDEDERAALLEGE